MLVSFVIIEVKRFQNQRKRRSWNRLKTRSREQRWEMMGNCIISLPYGVFMAYIIILNFYLLFFLYTHFCYLIENYFFTQKHFCVYFFSLQTTKFWLFVSFSLLRLISLFAIHSTPIVNIVCCIKWTLKNSIIFLPIPFLEIYRSILLCLFNWSP